MRTVYLTLKYVQPIEVKLKDEFSLFNMLCEYIDTYGELFIGIYDTVDEAIEAQAIHYTMYGDIELCKDLNTLYSLENCLAITGASNE